MVGISGTTKEWKIEDLRARDGVLFYPFCYMSFFLPALIYFPSLILSPEINYKNAVVEKVGWRGIVGSIRNFSLQILRDVCLVKTYTKWQ